MERPVIYLDANVIIRFIEGIPEVRSPIATRLRNVTHLTTSELSRMECRCRPVRDGNKALLSQYDGFFSGHELELIDIDSVVIDKATELRARLNLKTPDAIHLASAIVSGASLFLTGDRQ